MLVLLARHHRLNGHCAYTLALIPDRERREKHTQQILSSQTQVSMDVDNENLFETPVQDIASGMSSG